MVSISDERLAFLLTELRNHGGSKLATIYTADYVAALAELQSLRAAAKVRAKDAPIGPELWGRQPGTGLWVQIDDGSHTDEEVASFKATYAAAGWTNLRRTNPFASKGGGEVKAAVQKAYDAINAGGAPYSERECRASYAISTALASLDAASPAAKVRAIREGDGEWDILARAACRVAWPNFNAFGTESKSKRMQEMREAMIAASPIPATGGEKE